MDVVTVTDRAVIEAALADPRFVVVVPDPAETGGLAWVRANVGRFSEGATHERRRGLAERELAAMEPDSLRKAAYAEAIAGADPAHEAPTRALAAVLGVIELDRIAAAVPVAASGYLTGAPATSELDAAVADLVALLGPREDETVAARIGLFLQSYQATAALVTAALALASRRPDASAESLISQAIHGTPPVPLLRRVTAEEVSMEGRVLPPGTSVHLDVSTHPGLTFGTGRRPCPGRAQAIAIATGVVEAVTGR